MSSTVPSTPTTPIKADRRLSTSTTLESIYPLLSRYFVLNQSTVSYKQRQSGELPRLDDHAVDALYMVLHALTSANEAQMQPHYVPVLKLLLNNVYTVCDSYILCRLAAQCVTVLLHTYHNGFNDTYQTSMALINTAGGNRTMGLYSLQHLISAYGALFITSPTELLYSINKLYKRNELAIRQQCAEIMNALISSHNERMKNVYDTNEIIRLSVKLSNDTDCTVRYRACTALCSIATIYSDSTALSTVVPAIIKLLGDNDVPTRCYAAQSFGATLSHISSITRTTDTAKQSRKSQYDIESIDDAMLLIQRNFSKPNMIMRASLSITLQYLLHTTTITEFNVSHIMKPLIDIILSINTENDKLMRQAVYCLQYAVCHGAINTLRVSTIELLASHLLAQLSVIEYQHTNYAYGATFIISIIKTAVLRLSTNMEHSKLRDNILNQVLQLLNRSEYWLHEQIADLCYTLALQSQSFAAAWISVLHKIAELQLEELTTAHQQAESLHIHNSIHGHLCCIAAVISSITNSVNGVSVHILHSTLQVTRNALQLNYNAINNAAWLVVLALNRISVDWCMLNWSSTIQLIHQTINKSSSHSDLAHEIITSVGNRTRAIQVLHTLVNTCRNGLSDSQMSSVASITKVAYDQIDILQSSSKSIGEQNALIRYKQAICAVIILLPINLLKSTPESITTQLLTNLISQAKSASTVIYTHLNNHDNILSNTIDIDDDCIVMVDMSGEISDISSQHTVPDYVDQKLHQITISHIQQCAGGTVTTNYIRDCFNTSQTNNQFISDSSHLADTCIQLFCQLFTVQTNANKSAIIKHFDTVINKVQSTAHKLAIPLLNIISAIHTLSKYNSTNNKPINDLSISVSLYQICLQLFSSTSSLVRRAACESIGYLVAIEDHVFVQRAIDGINGLLTNTDHTVMSTAAFALANIHLHCNNIQRQMPFTIAALQSLCRDNNPLTRTWMMHSYSVVLRLCRTPDTYIESTYNVVYVQALHDVSATNSIMLQGIAQVCTSLLSVYIAGTLSVNTVAERVIYWYHYIKLNKSIIVQVQCLLLLYQLIQLQIAAMVTTEYQYIVDMMNHENNVIRYNALRCVSLLVQYNNADRTWLLIQNLYKIYDNETNVDNQQLISDIIQKQIELINTIDNKIVPHQSNIQLLILDCSKRSYIGWSHQLPTDKLLKKASDSQHRRLSQNSTDGDGESLEDTIVEHDNNDDNRIHNSPSAQSMIFGLNCIKQVLLLRTNKPDNELDIKSAHKSKYPLQYVSQHIPDLVHICVAAINSDNPSIALNGIECMALLLQCFTQSNNMILLQPYVPLMSGAITYALRSKSDDTQLAVAPILRQYGAHLAVKYILCGIIDEQTVINRICKLLSEPLIPSVDHCTSQYSQYDSSMALGIIQSHVTALSNLLLASGVSEAIQQHIKSAVQPYESTIHSISMQAVQDTALLTLIQPDAIHDITGELFIGSNTTPLRLIQLFDYYNNDIIIAASNFVSQIDSNKFDMNKITTILLSILINKLHNKQQSKLQRKQWLQCLSCVISSGSCDTEPLTYILPIIDGFIGSRTLHSSVGACVVACVQSLQRVSNDNQPQTQNVIEQLVHMTGDLIQFSSIADKQANGHSHDTGKLNDTTATLIPVLSDVLQLITIFELPTALINISTILSCIEFELCHGRDDNSKLAADTIGVMVHHMYDYNDREIYSQWTALSSAYNDRLIIVLNHLINTASLVRYTDILTAHMHLNIVQPAYNSTVLSAALQCNNTQHVICTLQSVQQYVSNSTDTQNLNSLFNAILCNILELFAFNNDTAIQTIIAELLSQQYTSLQSTPQHELLLLILPLYAQHLSTNNRLLSPLLTIATASPELFRSALLAIDSTQRAQFQATIQQLQSKRANTNKPSTAVQRSAVITPRPQLTTNFKLFK